MRRRRFPPDALNTVEKAFTELDVEKQKVEGQQETDGVREKE